MKIITKQNPFKKIIPQDVILKDFSVDFQQAMECIIEGKEEMANSFKEEMDIKKNQMDEYCKSICFETSSGNSSTSLYHLYLQYEMQIAEKMSSVLDWILAKKSSIKSDPIETELFVLADSAAETIDNLSSLSKKLASKKFKGKKNKKNILKNIDEIKDKSKKTFDLSLRMKRKILENISDNSDMIHLVLLADIIGQAAEKTRDTAWLAASMSC